MINQSFNVRGVATGRARGHAPNSISEPNKVHKFQFQTLGILLFTNVQKLYGPEVSIFTILQFLDNLWQLFIFSNYIGKIAHFTLNPLKRSNT